MTDSSVNSEKWHRSRHAGPFAGEPSRGDSIAYCSDRTPRLAKARERAERCAIIALAVGGVIFAHYALRLSDPLSAPLVAVPIVCGYFFLRLYRAKDAEAKNFERLYRLHRDCDDAR